MFSRRKTFSSRLIFDRKAFNEIIHLLELADFSNISVKIPDGYKIFRKKNFTPSEFIALKYNFTAQILSAENPKQKEIIKILFVNNSGSKTTFNDEIFLSGHSVSSQYYLETVGPVRLVGLNDFAKDTLERCSIRDSGLSKMQNFLYFIGTIYLFLWWMIFIPTLAMADGFSVPFFSSYHYGNAISVSLLVTSFLYLFYIKVYPGGLYVVSFVHPTISFTRRIFVGDLKNNLIIHFFIWIIKVVIIGVAVGFISNLTWALMGESILDFIPK